MVSSTWRITKDEALADHAMVAATHPLAAEAGLDVLRRGGNAVDAAVTMSLVLGVVQPHLSGIGGGGLMVIHQANPERVFTIDCAMDAPMAATPDVYELETGTGAGMFGWRRVKDDANIVGYRAVAVPGLVRGLAMALERFGTISLQEALQPAIRHAAEGIEVSWDFSLHIGLCMRVLSRFPGTASLLLPDGFPLRSWSLAQPADRLVQPDLARTLSLIAQEGPGAFYEGPIAQTIAEAMRQNGGLVTEEDLARYQATIEEGGMAIDYRGYQVVGMPGPTGCVTALQSLNILEGYDLASLEAASPESLHLRAEAFRRAFADRYRYVADPKQVPVPWRGLLSKQYAQVVRERINPTRATDQVEPGDAWAFDGPAPPLSYGLESPARMGGTSTTHLCAVDRERNAVSLTQTVVDAFGSGVIVPGTGVVLNNAMQWFDPEPGRPNSVAPGRRGVLNMAPLLVLRHGRPFLAVGALGGRRIINAVTQVVLNVVDHGMGPQEAVAAPRIDCSGPDVLVDSRFPESLAPALRAMGHRVQLVQETFHAENFARPLAILVDPRTGRLRGGVDPLRPAVAMGY